MSAVLQMTDVSQTHGEGATLVHALRTISFAAYAGAGMVGRCTRSRLPLVARID